LRYENRKRKTRNERIQNNESLAIGDVYKSDYLCHCTIGALQDEAAGENAIQQLKAGKPNIHNRYDLGQLS
jgi:hypothetical protein